MVFITTKYWHILKNFNIPDQPLRTQFKLPSKEAIKWFPGHMYTGLKQMQRRLTTIDCVVEIHDARIPLSGRNPNFKYTVIGPKPHILVLNKMDLVDSKFNAYVIDYLKKRERLSHVIYTDCKDQDLHHGVKNLIPLITELVKSGNRYHRTDILEYNVMVIGVPNVGKSSIINALRSAYTRKNKVAPVGAIAGMTRSVGTRIKVSSSPLIYILDTPGILTPTIEDVEVGMRLALCSTFKDFSVGEINVADYLLYWFNKRGSDRYFDFFGINKPCDNISLLLAKKAIENDVYIRIRDREGNLVNKPHLQSVAQQFINAFRSGLLGLLILDSEELNLCQ